MPRFTNLFVAVLLGGGVVSASANLTYVSQVHGVISANLKVGANDGGNVGLDELIFTDGTHNIQTICADLFDRVDTSPHPYIQELTNAAGLSAGVQRAGHIVAANFSTSLNVDQSAGLQLAVWDAIYTSDTTFNSGGTFVVTNISSDSAAILAQAKAYFDSSVGGTGVANYYFTSSPGGQSQMNAVPEPMSFAAFAIGIGGLLARRRATRKAI